MKSLLDERIKEIILRNMTRPVENIEINPDSDLINDLALSSIEIVNLLVEIEEEFNIQIDTTEITMPIFSEYRQLREFLLTKMASQLSYP